MTGISVSGPNTYDELRHHVQELQAMNDELGVATKVGIPPERRPLDSPIVLDTDIGGDADDAIAVSAAAADPHLTLVVTSDETPDGSRARFVRLLLDQLGRRDVRVIQGAAFSTKPYSSIDHIDTRGAQPDDVGLDAIYSAVQTWFDNYYPSTIQHDALALSVALALPFVRQGFVRAEIDEIGRLSKTGIDDGCPVFVSYEAYYEAFWQWLEKQLPLNAV